MKVLFINGSPKERGCTYTALREVASQLRENNIETEILHIGAGPILDCMACGACRETGRCFEDDVVNIAARRMKECDALIVGCPVYFAGPSGRLVCFLDRLFYSAGGTFAGKLGACVVSARRGGCTASLDRLAKYFEFARMPMVSSTYWNMVHGNTPEEVAQDREGLQTMRNLGRDMAWMLRCIEVSRNAGVPVPAAERAERTNFIR